MFLYNGELLSTIYWSETLWTHCSCAATNLKLIFLWKQPTFSAYLNKWKILMSQRSDYWNLCWNWVRIAGEELKLVNVLFFVQKFSDFHNFSFTISSSQCTDNWTQHSAKLQQWAGVLWSRWRNNHRRREQIPFRYSSLSELWLLWRVSGKILFSFDIVKVEGTTELFHPLSLDVINDIDWLIKRRLSFSQLQ